MLVALLCILGGKEFGIREYGVCAHACAGVGGGWVRMEEIPKMREKESS